MSLDTSIDRKTETGSVGELLLNPNPFKVSCMRVSCLWSRWVQGLMRVSGA